MAPGWRTADSSTARRDRSASLRRKTYPGRVRRTADPSATLRSGRDDKERATVERERSPDRYVFHHLGWAAGPYNTRNDKKERVVVSVGLLPSDSAVVGAAGTPPSTTTAPSAPPRLCGGKKSQALRMTVSWRV